MLLCWEHKYLQIYIFNLDWCLYHYIMTFILDCHSLCLIKSILSKYRYLRFLLVFICMENLFPSLYFQFVYFLYLRWVPCGQHTLGWPKSSFGIFHKISWKTKMNFFANPIHWYFIFLSIQPLYVFWLNNLVHLHLK